MSEVTLTRVYRGTQETKYGIKDKVSIQTQEHGDKWLSMFVPSGAGDPTADWKEGDVVKIDISEKGDFMNFKVSGGASKASAPASPALEARVVKLEEAVFGGAKVTASMPAEEVIHADDLPDFDNEEDSDGF